MYLWSGEGNTSVGTHYIGNGEMLIEGSGPNITAVSGPPYTSLPFFSAVIDDKTRKITALTQFDNGVWQHKLTCSPSSVTSFNQTAYFIRFTDHIDRLRSVFIRRFHAIQPLTLKLIIPPYVKVYYNETYRLSGNYYHACAVFTIRETAAAYLSDEQRLICVINGETEFNKADHEICLKTGDGSIILASGTPDKAIRNAVYILNSYSHSYDRTRLYYSEYLSRFHEVSHNEQHIVRSLSLLESAAAFLINMQSADGGVIKSISQPFADMSMQYYCLRAFLALGCRSEAKSILDFMLLKFNMFGDLKAFESTGSNLNRKSSGAGYAAVPAYCILSAAEYLKFSGDKNYIITLIPMLIYAADIQIKNARGGLMISDGCETAITGRYITHKAAYAVSLRNTLLYIESLKAMLYIGEILGREMISHISAVKAAERAENAFFDSFIINGVFQSYAKCPDGTRRERFRPGICDKCGDMFSPRLIVLLERYEDMYLCESCYNSIPFRNIITAEAVTDETVTSDILLIPYLGSDIVDKTAILAYTETNKKAETGFLPVVTGFDKCCNSDAGLLLYALTEYGAANSDRVFQSLVDAAGSNDLWSEHNGSEECTAYTNAVCVQAIIKYLNSSDIL